MSKQSKINENSEKNIISLKELESRLDYIINSFTENNNESECYLEKNEINDFKDNKYFCFSENKNNIEDEDSISEKNKNEKDEKNEKNLNKLTNIKKDFIGFNLKK